MRVESPFQGEASLAIDKEQSIVITAGKTVVTVKKDGSLEVAGEEDLKRGDARLRRFDPRGTLLRLDLDNKIWLAWGLPAELPSLMHPGDVLVAEPPVQTAARLADVERLHLGGLLWPEATGRLARTAYATREGLGRGQVILFAGDPGFRNWTLGTRRLLLNAIFYGPGLGTRWSNPW